ncbi:hypothetical protein HY478_00980 [Candidatus Uhrbacteria bacterium]|nr:hypothetical protein [Candidatus Uhrbacteria bacterium]
MLVFAAITPHSPLLLPTIGRGKEKQLAGTHKAFEELAAKLKEARPDVLLVISPHGPVVRDAITLNLHEAYEGDLSEFGDIGTRPRFEPAPALAERFRRILRGHQVPLCLASSHVVDYGVSVPLVLTMQSGSKIIPMGPALDLDFKLHFKTGEILKEEIVASQKRVALIASSDLSHRLASDAPAGFSPQGQKFDTTLREALEAKNTSRLLGMDPELVVEAAPCGFRAILLALGILSEAVYTPRTLAYEAPFGVGYLTMDFALSV